MLLFRPEEDFTTEARRDTEKILVKVNHQDTKSTKEEDKVKGNSTFMPFFVPLVLGGYF